MSTLTVSEVTKSLNGRVDMRIRYDDVDEALWFELPDGFKPHSDQIAAAVAAIFGTTFDEVQFLEPISAEIRTRLSKATNSVWQAPKFTGSPVRGGDAVTLGFSGGFDSLAALAVLGDKTKLVSIDFGQRFERERNFFATFPTTTVATNARSFERTWTFMGIGNILLREYCGADFMAFGSVLEASLWNFLAMERAIKTHPIYAAAGLTSVNPLVGFSEFATTRLAAQTFPDRILASLASLAEPHTEKYLRKISMLKHINEDMALGLDLSNVVAPSFASPLKLGTQFSADFLASGMLRFCPDEVSQWMDLPNGFVEHFSGISASFYERMNTGVWYEAPKSIATTVAANLAGFGITPYRPGDWEAFGQVIDMLKIFHRFPGPTMV